jgi:mono/diheme cytochrome c family protein
VRAALYVALILLTPIVFAAQDAASGDGPRSNHWTIPETAARERNPLTLDPPTMARGQALFSQHCRRCHGPSGKNGPDSDPAFTNADLTDRDRATLHPDGIVFYKIWNGKGGLIPHERMPGFGFHGPLSVEEVWALVAYVQTLRGGRENR